MTRTDIAFFVPDLGAGGVERMRVHLANEFSDRGYGVDLVLARSRGPFLSKVNAGVNIVDLEGSHIPSLGIVPSSLRILKYLRSVEPHIFVSSMNHVNIINIPVFKISLADSELVVSEHNPPRKSTLKNKLVNELASITYDWADYIIAVSEGVAEEISETYSLCRVSINVIYNPVVTDEIFNKMNENIEHSWISNPEYKVVLGIGRFHVQKDFETLIRSFNILSKDTNSWKLLMLGEGDRRQYLEDLVNELDLTDSVDFLGYVDNPYKYMHNASVFALSSRWEGFGNVIVEALACGCPIVSTDCPTGPREILADGEYGKLVPVGDEVELAEGIRATVTDPPDPNKLRKRANDFTVESIATQYENLLLK